MHNKPLFSIPFIITLILLVGCLPQIASDIYAPSLPAIAQYFSVSINHAQWSMPLYMCGIALSLFIYGPLSDGIGRKSPLITGLVIMLIGTLLCAFAGSMTMLLVGRFIQGCGVGACAGLWRSIFRDIFSGDDLAKYGSYFSIILIFVIPAAPVLGGYLQEHISWRASFTFLITYVILALYVVIFHFRESNQYHHISKLKYEFIRKAFHTLLTSRIFIGYGLSVLLSYGAFFSWFTVGPVLLIDIAHISPSNFGWLNFISGSTAMAIAGFANARLVKCYGTHCMLQFGWSVMLLSGILLLIVHATLGVNVPAIIACMFLFFFSTFFIWPNAFASAIDPFACIAGYAGAMYSAMQLGGGAIISAVAAHVPDHNQVPFALIIIGCAMCAWLVYRLVAYPAKCQHDAEK